MNAARPRHLCKALNASFDLFACNHHQIGHFVHDHDNERHDLGLELFGFEDRLTRILVKARLDSALEHFAFGQSIAHAAIIAFDIAHPHFRHFAIDVNGFTTTTLAVNIRVPVWSNGQGVGLLTRRLRVPVPPCADHA